MESSLFLGRICRTCMAEKQSFHSILDTGDEQLKICEILATAVPLLRIQANDQLPELICSACLNKLNIAYQFQQMCIATDKRLRAQVKISAAAAAAAPVFNAAGEENTELFIRECVKMEIEGEKYQLNFVAPPHNTEKSRKMTPALLNGTLPECSESEESGECPEVRGTFGHENRKFQQTAYSSSEDGTHNRTRAIKIEDSDSNEPLSMLKIVEQAKAESPLGDDQQSDSNSECSDSDERPNRRRGHFLCTHCNQVFDRAYRLRRHAGVHSLDRPYQCDICKYRFVTENHLTFHKSLHTCVVVSSINEKQSETTLPNNSTVDKQRPAVEYKCPKCSRRFEKPNLLSLHMQCHRKPSDAELFCCQHCGDEFSMLNDLENHVKTHPERQHKCHICPKTFLLEELLMEHLKIHNGPQPFICLYCDKSYQHNSSLKAHLKTHTGEKTYNCPKCDKSFYKGSNMRQHLLRHSDERCYHCPECPSRFACHSDLSKHMSTHRTIKPHVCDICGSRFSRSYTLNKHKLIHTGERPHKCEQCSMTFILLSHLRRHMLTHTGEKPYKCKYCDRAYAATGDLNKHLRSHVGKKTYFCLKCPKTFKYLTELRSHTSKHYMEQQQQQQQDQLTIDTASTAH